GVPGDLIDMSQTLPPGYVIPNPGPPKVIGILNIVFGALLLLYGLCQGAGALFMPVMQGMMETQQKQTEAEAKRRQEERIAAQLKELDAKEQAAQDDEEKKAIQAQREELKSQPPPFTPNTTMGFAMYSNPTIKAFNWGDIITCLIVNVPLL